MTITRMAFMFFVSIAFFDLVCIDSDCQSEADEALYRIDKGLLDYVLNKYEHELFGRKCLFYPATNPKRLVIVFSGATPGYNLWSWFWKDTEDWSDTAYLFLRDENKTWYLGDDKRRIVDDYLEIIQFFLTRSSLPSDKVISIGSSMGGYAAIFYAVIRSFKGAIAFNPQVDRASASGSFSVGRAQSCWVDLDTVVASAVETPHVSLNFCSFSSDTLAAYKLLDQLKQKNSVTIFRKGQADTHTTLKYNKKLIETDIWFIENAIDVGIGKPTME